MPKGTYKRNIDGSKNPNWKGGRLTKKNGYIIIHLPYHPFCSKDGYVLEHRLIMEKYIKRFLSPEEQIHHINFIVDDNRIKNLQLFSNHSEHMKHEYKFRKRNKKGQFLKTTKPNKNN